jgi:hypothetical protein
MPAFLTLQDLVLIALHHVLAWRAWARRPSFCSGKAIRRWLRRPGGRQALERVQRGEVEPARGRHREPEPPWSRRTWPVPPGWSPSSCTFPSGRTCAPPGSGRAAGGASLHGAHCRWVLAFGLGLATAPSVRELLIPSSRRPWERTFPIASSSSGEPGAGGRSRSTSRSHRPPGPGRPGRALAVRRPPGGGEEAEEPVASEFRQVYEEQRFGLPLRMPCSGWRTGSTWWTCGSS